MNLLPKSRINTANPKPMNPDSQVEKLIGFFIDEGHSRKESIELAIQDLKHFFEGDTDNEDCYDSWCAVRSELRWLKNND